MTENGKDIETRRAEAVEELAPDEDETVTDQETVDGWKTIFDSFMEKLNEEDVTAWLQKVFSEPAEGDDQADPQSAEGGLSSLLQGLFSAFVKETND